MADRLYTSSDAAKTLSDLGYLTGLEFVALARLALAYSIKKVGDTVQHSSDFSGKEIRKTFFFGTDESVLRSLVRVIYRDAFEDDDRFFSRRSVCKDHIDNGLKLLADVFEQCGRNPDVFFQKLAAEIPSPAAGRAYGPIPHLDIEVGKDIKNTPVVLEINNTSRHSNPHVAIIGQSGSGKTQILLKILADIRKQSDFRTNFILFDYSKGDIASNTQFIETSRATVYNPAAKPLPLNPFVLDIYDEKSIIWSAEAKADSFSSISAHFGFVQKSKLAKSITRAYEQRADQDLPYPDFGEVLEIARAMYKEDKATDDSLIETLRRLSDFSLFWEHGDQQQLISSLWTQTIVIDLSKLQALKELVAYLVIEQLYRQMSGLPDSETLDDRRQIRTVLAIDEAHNYLPQKNSLLQTIVREGRSRGVAVFFASQSPSDYEQDGFDFKEHLEFSLILQCKVKSASAVQNLISCSPQAAKQLRVNLAHLNLFEVISKAIGEDRDYTRFMAIPFFEASKTP